MLLLIVSISQSGETALHVAARYGHTATVDYLCSVDANINLFDNVSAV